MSFFLKVAVLIQIVSNWRSSYKINTSFNNDYTGCCCFLLVLLHNNNNSFKQSSSPTSGCIVSVGKKCAVAINTKTARSIDDGGDYYKEKVG